MFLITFFKTYFVQPCVFIIHLYVLYNFVFFVVRPRQGLSPREAVLHRHGQGDGGDCHGQVLRAYSSPCPGGLQVIALLV